MGGAWPSKWLIDALAFVPIAVLTAILVPAVLIDPATQQIIVKGNARIVAAVVATIIALLTRNVIATIISGANNIMVFAMVAVTCCKVSHLMVSRAYV